MSTATKYTIQNPNLYKEGKIGGLNNEVAPLTKEQAAFNLMQRISDPNTPPEQLPELQKALQESYGIVDNRPFDDSPGGIDSVPPDDGGADPSKFPGTYAYDSDKSTPAPEMTESAREAAESAQKYENGFVGQDTNNVVDPEYVPRNDFASEASSPAQSSSGGLKDGIWESLEYATDWNAHHGKFKFLFKVYLGGPWQFYAKSCTKPKVKMIHQEVNYYNFRSKVLTQVNFDPMTIVLWDEIGNSVHKFFATYLSYVSGQGSGNWGIDTSFEPGGNRTSSSSKSYRNAGHGDPILATVIIEQIFANGTKSNRFIFKNARIEAMDFDDMTMDTTDMNSLSIVFNYDSIECKTVERSVIHTDPSASKDLLRGGGAAGSAYGANDDGRQFNPISIGGVTSPFFSGSSNNPFNVESIFGNAVPNISTNFSIGPNGLNANISGGFPGLVGGNISVGPGGVYGNFSGGVPGFTGGISVGPNGVSGGLSVGVPGFGANLQVGPNGVSGGIAGGLPGIGGQLQFGPGGISGNIAGGIPGVSGGIAFNPNGVSGTIQAAISSTSTQVIRSIQPPVGSVVSEATYLNSLSCAPDDSYVSSLIPQPFGG
jgi:hypothetical protein